MRVMWLLVALVALVVASCGGSSKCVEGASAACACTSGGSGAQVCTSSGSYGPCECGSGAKQPGSGSDATWFDAALERTRWVPSESTRKLVAGSPDPIEVHLFFPDPNPVKDEVVAYFEALRLPAKLRVRAHDRLVDAALASKYRVVRDGVVVLTRGTGDQERKTSIEVHQNIQHARKRDLPRLDAEVSMSLVKLLREKRKAYLTSGHGEITDRNSVPPDLRGRVPERRTTLLKQQLGDLNFEVKDLAPAALEAGVPGDATIVMVLAPTTPLAAAEWAALDAYAKRGGGLFIALDPKGDPELGALEQTLGLKFNPSSITDDVSYVKQRGTVTDRRFAVTSQFSAHPSTTSLARTVGQGIVLLDSGALEELPFMKPDPPTRTFTIRSMVSSFLDHNDNYQLDVAGPKPEKKQRWNIAAAIEGGALGSTPGFRALVFADADLFADTLTRTGTGRASVMMVSGRLLVDSLRWLAREDLVDPIP